MNGGVVPGNPILFGWRWKPGWFLREQGGAFEQAAEIFFAGVLMLAVGELEVRGGFVADFEPFEVDDADEFLAALPDLALLKFHGREIHLSCFLIQER